MPLNIANLKDSLLKLSESRLTLEDFCKDFSTIYADFAATGLAVPGSPQFTGNEKIVLKNSLFSGLEYSSDPATAAQIFTVSINNFWTTPPIVFGPPPIVGIVSSVNGIPVFSTGLTSLFSVYNDLSVYVDAMASLLDAVTKSVLVFYQAPLTPNPPPPSTIL